MANMILLQVALFVCFTLLIGPRYLRKYTTNSKIIQAKGCEAPPSLPQKDPFFGLDVVFFQLFRSHKIRSINAHVQQLFASHGHTFKSTPYGRTEIFTISPSNIQAVYATDFDSFGVGPFRNFVFEPLLGNGVMTTDGPMWKHSRAMIAPSFARTQIEDLTTFDLHVSRLLAIIPRDGTTVDLQPLFQRLALDSTTEFLFGKSVDSLAPETPPDAQTFLDAYNYAQHGVGFRMLLPFWNVFTRDKKFWESCNIAHVFVDKVIDRTIQQIACSKNKETQKYTLAYELVKATNDRTDIRQQLLNVFLPAHDAIAIPLTNIFFNLARHPKVWTKLRQEILAIDRSELSPSRLKSIRYLHKVINETQRLYPGVAMNERMALRNTVLPTGGGASGDAPIFVEKGDRITIGFYALQRRKDIWGEDAEEFNPERWDSVKPGPWTCLPFGGGPRVCPGQERGLMEVAYAVVRIVSAFKEIDNRDPVEEFEDFHRVVTVSRNGAKVALIPE